MTSKVLFEAMVNLGGGRCLKTVYLTPPTTALIDFEFQSTAREAKTAWARCGPGLSRVSGGPYGSRYKVAFEENCSPVAKDPSLGDARPTVVRPRSRGRMNAMSASYGIPVLRTASRTPRGPGGSYACSRCRSATARHSVIPTPKAEAIYCSSSRKRIRYRH